MEERMKQLRDNDDLAPEDILLAAAEAQDQEDELIASKQRE